MAPPYATSAELKAELQPDDAAFTRDDSLYTALVQEASDAIDKYCHRTFTVPSAATARTYKVDRTGHFIIGLDDIANTTGLTVESDAADTGSFAALTVNTDYFLELENESGRVVSINPTGHFPVSRLGRRTVRITARYGWPSVPTPVHRACLLWARRLYVRKDSPAGVLGFGDLGAVRLSSTDPDIRALLDPFVKYEGMLA